MNSENKCRNEGLTCFMSVPTSIRHTDKCAEKTLIDISEDLDDVKNFNSNTTGEDVACYSSDISEDFDDVKNFNSNCTGEGVACYSSGNKIHSFNCRTKALATMCTDDVLTKEEKTATSSYITDEAKTCPVSSEMKKRILDITEKSTIPRKKTETSN